MGLMLRWLAGVGVVLGALYATVSRPRSAPAEPELDPGQQRVYQLSAHQRRAVRIWSALAARDSAKARLATLSLRTGRPEIITVGFVGAASSPEAQKVVGDRWTAVGAPDSSVLTLVMIYNEAQFDSLRSQVYPYSGALLVPGSANDVCVAMTPGSRNAHGDIDVVSSQLDRALAPCLLRAAFGIPGRGMRDWLERTRAAAAKSNAWLRRQDRAVLDGSGQLPWEPMYEQVTTGRSETGLSSLLRSLAAFEIAVMTAPPYQMGSAALRCLEGNTVACTRTVLDSFPLHESLSGDLTLSHSWEFGLRNRRNALLSVHPIGDWFLSDMIRLEGRERFGRFWRSDQPFEIAFREAFGRDLGEWTRDWGVRQRRGSWEAQFTPAKPVTLGVSLHPSWALLTLGWTAAALLLAAWTARRRQVT
jgi:hypothetical protein